MKPLVNYCRRQGAKLRLIGREEKTVWGQIVFFTEDGQEKPVSFRFDISNAELSMMEENGQRLLKIDELGIPY